MTQSTSTKVDMNSGATNPSVTVVTISYNQAAFLERAIESVLSQTGVDVEYIVVDPGSTDGSRGIIEKYRDRISRVVFEPDEGPADGLNVGLSHASKPFFYYLNADDEVCPGALSNATKFLRDNPRFDVVYGNGVDIDENGVVRRPLVSSSRVTTAGILHGASTIVQQAAVIRTSALKRVGGFNSENRTCWDGEAFLAIASSGGRFKRIWETWGRFRIHGASISGSGRLEDRYRADIERMFVCVTGHRRTWADKQFGLILRIANRIGDPIGTYSRVLARAYR